MIPVRIVSGGQTGVDRAALDAALAAGLECGGWCPAGRRAEDGPIPARYPLLETDDEAYGVRTRRNVRDSDATLIVCDVEPAGGTALTLVCCQEEGRPVLVVDASAEAPEAALNRLRSFLQRHAVQVLNVAGPRASESPQAGRYAATLLSRLLSRATP